jgi:LPXTG-motif cell wall-anchored protein
MTQHSTPLRIAAGLLFASAAFPLAPAFAQVTPTDPAAGAPPPADAPPPVQTRPTVPVSSGVQASEPVINTRASGNEPADPAAGEGASAATDRPTARRTARSAARPAARAERRAAPQPRAVRAEAPAAPAPAPVPIAAPAPAPVAAAPVGPVPPAEAPPAAAPAPEAAAPATAPDAGGQGTSIWPWLLAAGLAIAGLLFFFRRRRRADETDHVAYAAPVAVAEPRPQALAEAAPAPAAAPVAAAAGATASGRGERPWLDLQLRPVRAGVGEDSARVEFQLDIENTGSVHASDVRISTWMLAGGTEPTEVERMLIQRPAEAERRETELAPGEAARLETEVALPREGLHDAILPVVVADARYRLPDGSEGRTAVSFAVGVPDGEELVMFDVENPSGLHEGVEARLHGTPKRD